MKIHLALTTLWVNWSMAAAQVSTFNISCGQDTFLDENVCQCDRSAACTNAAADNTTIFLAGLLDTGTYPWVEEVFGLVFRLVNNHSDGWLDDLLDDGTVVDYEIANSACDESTATQAYWRIHQEHTIHGIVGCRCSGASIAVARIAGLQGVPQISPTSKSARLSEKNEFPLFSRMVAPDNGDGEVGAISAVLREFGWNRVTILSTDTQYAKDFVSEFKKDWLGDNNSNWTGEVAYSNTITLAANGDVDLRSATQALESIPVDEPTVNSRVVLLVATEEHAFTILQTASETGFQPDTIYVGPSWPGIKSSTTSWLPSIPGYLGVAPYIDRTSPMYQDFFLRLLQARGLKIDDSSKVQDLLPLDLDHWAISYTVDSIVSLIKALSEVSPTQRLNGTAVTEKLRAIDGYIGITGEISLTSQGDRQNPHFTVVNYQEIDGQYECVEIGRTGTRLGSVVLNGERICFAGTGCGGDIPDDSYPVPKVKAQTWVLVMVPTVLILFMLIAFKYWRSKVGKRRMKESITELERRVQAVVKIDEDLIDIEKQVEAAKEKKNRLILARLALTENKPTTWTDTTELLVEVDPTDDQYWNVTERLQETMKDAHIAKLWRIQNTALWSYYSFHKDRLASHGVDTNEQSVWHGTSALDPSVIYEDRQDGFMMQYSHIGLWGRGIYFAKNSSYSCCYSYKPGQSSISADRPKGNVDEREMFLTKLLSGNEVDLGSDQQLMCPPINPMTGLRYNTVSGNTGGSQIWIVYENGRAYPDYLVRYYRGHRDPLRTPFGSRMEVPFCRDNDVSIISC